ncbi:MAG TPA: acetyltransferase [Bacteroidales bacterium]|nr:acetyltransferase [Bacteroidales bacterium]
MIIAGAGSAGRETLGILVKYLNYPGEVVFYDDNKNIPPVINGEYKVIKDEESLKRHVKKDPSFCVAIGNPRLRERVFKKFVQMGAEAVNVISSNVFCLSQIENNGTIIQPGAVLSFDVKIGKSCMIHAHCTIGHKVEIGDFVNTGPLVSIIGPAQIGDFCYIGAGAVILPNIEIGKHVIISAGSIVKRNVQDYECL